MLVVIRMGQVPILFSVGGNSCTIGNAQFLCAHVAGWLIVLYVFLSGFSVEGVAVVCTVGRAQCLWVHVTWWRLMMYLFSACLQLSEKQGGLALIQLMFTCHVHKLLVLVAICPETEARLHVLRNRAAIPCRRGSTRILSLAQKRC